MDTSKLPDNLSDRLDLCIQGTTGHLRERFIAIRDAPDFETRAAMYLALKSDLAMDNATDPAVADARRWITVLRPFLQPGERISLSTTRERTG